MARSGVARGAHALWLRCDLRLDDNLALRAACEGADTLVPLYVFNAERLNVPTLAGARKSSARRTRFLLESLTCLRKSLESLGSGLAVAVGKPEEAIPALCSGQVWVTQGVCSEEQWDEARVAKRLKGCGGQLNKVWGGTLYMPEDSGCRLNDIPLLFTSFKNKVEGRGKIQDPLPAPKKLPSLLQTEELKKALQFMPSLEELGYSAEEAKEAQADDPRSVLPFEGGEGPALRRLQKWMFDDDRLKEYFEIRNGMKGEAFSSKLSPWLALGCISPRRVWKEAQRYERERVKNKSTYWLIFELTWRDFFIYMSNAQGTRIFMPGGVSGEKMSWRGSDADLQKWKDGRTGDQLVDANMRELKATGFMSNRGRQNVASYLIFDLGVDWRYGAAHFEEHLLDYEPCANWGNWVAAAGLTGQRVNKFNTKKQLNDYDPNREYVNHWLRGAGPTAAAGKTEPVVLTPGKGDSRGAEGAGPSASGRRWVRSSGDDRGKAGKGGAREDRSSYYSSKRARGYPEDDA